MLPKQLRRLLKKHDNKITYRPFATYNYGISALAAGFARLVEENKKLYVDTITGLNTCREELATNNFLPFCQKSPMAIKEHTAPDGRVIKDRCKDVSPSTSTVMVIYNYSYNHLSRTIKVLNRKEQSAKWGTTSLVNLGSVLTSDTKPAGVPGILVIASRNWLRSIPHLSMFILLLRLFNNYPIQPNESDEIYWKRLDNSAGRDGQWFKSFTDLHPRALDIFMKDVKALTKDVDLDNYVQYQGYDGVDRLTKEVNKIAGCLPDSKDVEEARKKAFSHGQTNILSSTHQDMGLEFAKLVLTAK